MSSSLKTEYGGKDTMNDRVGWSVASDEVDLDAAAERCAINNDPSLYDKAYFKQREDYMTKPLRFLFYAAVCIELGAKKVIDVGCGINTLCKYLRQLGVHAVGVDFSEDADADMIASAIDLPFDDGHFDLLITTDLMEHLEEQDIPKAIAEFGRVAPMQAHFICYDFMHAEPDTPYHCTLKSQWWWMAEFAKQGFYLAAEFGAAETKMPIVYQPLSGCTFPGFLQVFVPRDHYIAPGR